MCADTNDREIVGSEEWCALPELEIPAIKARIDTGAKTSSLHAFNIKSYTDAGAKWVSFDVNPLQNDFTTSVRCRALVIDRRDIKNTGGRIERRYVISSKLKIAGKEWNIELTLANRDSMGYRMLLGREAMGDRFLIDPAASLLLDPAEEGVYRGLYNKVSGSSSGLKVALLASNPQLYSNRRLMEAGKEAGHEMIFVDLSHCHMKLHDDNPELYYRRSTSLAGVDAVIPRIKPGLTFYGCAVLRQFESMGIPCLNNPKAITMARDKLHSLQVLTGQGLPTPATGFANSPLDTREIISGVGGAPVVIKLLEGAQGKGVVLADTDQAAESVINAFKSVRANILVQEYIKEAQGTDLRLFVVAGKVVASMKRVAPDGEFRANVHLGATVEDVKVSPTERKIAIKAAKVLGLDVAGVDIIRSKEGPKILEVNSSPGLEGIEKATRRDVAGSIIAQLEQLVSRSVRKKSARKVSKASAKTA